MQLQLFTESRFHKKDTRYQFTSPNWFIAYKDPGWTIDRYENMVLDLLQRSITHELFGLSFWDLMYMELPTFNKVRKRILDISEKQDAMRQKAEAEADKLNKEIMGK